MTVERIGRYVVQQSLGSGSFGDVFRVIDSEGSTTESCALKCIRTPSKEALARFKNEVWALSQLDHRAIPKLLDKGAADGREFFVMSLAPGTSLRKQHAAQREDGAPAGVKTVLTIVERVLDALCHMHERGICHRDVKDDNIITTPTAAEVHLIDLGFCHGSAQPTDPQTFWGAGAGRYSPPEKLRRPARVVPSHDVFAVGVVAYLLLTNQYPWSTDEDHGALEEEMLTQHPAPIHRLNQFVTREVSDCLARLLDIDDASRPSASEARASIQRIRERSAPNPGAGKKHAVAFSRVIRDPLHGDIRMTEFEWKLLATREMQRLRWIKQLGFTHLVYPGAEHTRLSHSIGVMHVSDRILRAIEDRTGIQLETEHRLAARAYGLVHDVSHVAYGHTLEDELAVLARHDVNEARIARLVLDNSSELGKQLKSTDFGRAVLSHFDPCRKEQRARYLDELLSGPAGADVIDYIDRDSYFSGLDHKVDTAIYRRFSLEPVDKTAPRDPHIISRLHGGLGLRIDAEFALESILLTRFSLFLKLYTHPMKVAAGAMLGKAVGYAVAGTEPELNESDLDFLGDVQLLARLSASKHEACRQLIDQLFNRKLYKAVFVADALEKQIRTLGHYETRLVNFRDKGLLTPKGREGLEAEIATRAGVKPQEVIVYCSNKAPGLKKATQYIERIPGQAELADEMYAPHNGIIERHLGLWRVYVFVSPAISQREPIGRISQAVLGLTNNLPVQRR